MNPKEFKTECPDAYKDLKDGHPEDACDPFEEWLTEFTFDKKSNGDIIMDFCGWGSTMVSNIWVAAEKKWYFGENDDYDFVMNYFETSVEE